MDLLPWFTRRQPQLLGLLRIVTGLLVLEHGAAKIFELPMPFSGSLPEPLSAAGAAELTWGFCVAVGCITRPAALVGFLISVEMAIGFFLMQFSSGFLLALNASEPPILTGLICLYIMSQGPGAWSVDGVMSKTRPR